MGSRSWPRQQAADYEESRGSTAPRACLLNTRLAAFIPPPCWCSRAGLETHQAAGNSVHSSNTRHRRPHLLDPLPQSLIVAWLTQNQQKLKRPINFDHL